MFTARDAIIKALRNEKLEIKKLFDTSQSELIERNSANEKLRSQIQELNQANKLRKDKRQKAKDDLKVQNDLDETLNHEKKREQLDNFNDVNTFLSGFDN